MTMVMTIVIYVYFVKIRSGSPRAEGRIVRVSLGIELHKELVVILPNELEALALVEAASRVDFHHTETYGLVLLPSFRDQVPKYLGAGSPVLMLRCDIELDQNNLLRKISFRQPADLRSATYDDPGLFDRVFFGEPLVLVVLVPWAEEILDVIPHRNVKNSPDEIVIIRHRHSQFDVR